ncbi:hypothetical protein D9M71_655860 [compost metagenome]
MGELALNPVRVVAALVKLGAQKVAEAVASLAACVAHKTQRLIDGVLAHWPICFLLTGE